MGTPGGTVGTPGSTEGMPGGFEGTDGRTEGRAKPQTGSTHSRNSMNVILKTCHHVITMISNTCNAVSILIFCLNWMFYQLFGVQHSCSSAQSYCTDNTVLLLRR